jgi:hypothetical protein
MRISSTVVLQDEESKVQTALRGRETMLEA